MRIPIFRKAPPDSADGPRYANWREYQEQLKKSQTPKKSRLWAAGAILLVCIFAGTLFTIGGLSPSAENRPAVLPSAEQAPEQEPLITKNDVRILLEHFRGEDLLAKQIDLPFKDRLIRVETSLDPDLQAYMIKAMDRKNSRFIGIVVMEADTGRVQALAGFNKTDPDLNPCLLNVFPAASIFKIVTAAAAVDRCGYDADTMIHFNGYKHTLYKNQLKDQINAYTNRVSFKDSFAQSVNPVFGKLGALKLDRSALETFARAFGFNQPIDFELPVEPSHIRIEDDAYQRAEIASGFNNDTTLSPVHAAMMASAVLNQGRLVAPTIVDRITDDHGRLLYEARPEWPGQAMTSQASSVLTRLMETTIRSGTGRKAFRDYARNRVLSKLDIGGKTGSIDNLDHDARFDWFVGFANEKKGPGRLAVAVLVAHEEFIGIRAAEYAKMAMTHYYKSQFAQRPTNPPSSGS